MSLFLPEQSCCRLLLYKYIQLFLFDNNKMKIFTCSCMDLQSVCKKSKAIVSHLSKEREYK